MEATSEEITEINIDGIDAAEDTKKWGTLQVIYKVHYLTESLNKW